MTTSMSPSPSRSPVASDAAVSPRAGAAPLHRARASRPPSASRGCGGRRGPAASREQIEQPVVVVVEELRGERAGRRRRRRASTRSGRGRRSRRRRRRRPAPTEEEIGIAVLVDVAERRPTSARRRAAGRRRAATSRNDPSRRLRNERGAPPRTVTRSRSMSRRLSKSVGTTATHRPPAPPRLRCGVMSVNVPSPLFAAPGRSARTVTGAGDDEVQVAVVIDVQPRGGSRRRDGSPAGLPAALPSTNRPGASCAVEPGSARARARADPHRRRCRSRPRPMPVTPRSRRRRSGREVRERPPSFRYSRMPGPAARPDPDRRRRRGRRASRHPSRRTRRLATTAVVASTNATSGLRSSTRPASSPGGRDRLGVAALLEIGLRKRRRIAAGRGAARTGPWPSCPRRRRRRG